MTKEEAIDLLDNLIGMVEDNKNSDYDTALKMGIKALDFARWVASERNKPGATRIKRDFKNYD